MQGHLFFSAPSAQMQTLRRVLFAVLAGGGAHTFICWIALQLDFFRASERVFNTLFAGIWGGHLVFVLFVLFGLNRRLREPAMIMPLMVWSTSALLVSVFFIDQIRLCVMMMFFAILQLGVFKASLRQFSAVALYCVIGYAVLLGLLGHYAPEVMAWRTDWIQWALFSMMVLAVVVLASEISGIRQQLALRNRQLAGVVERIRDMAVKDELTGLYQRRHAMELLKKACSQSSRGAYSLAVAYLDLDYFKRINDNYGHRIGDQVLVRFAELLRRYLSSKDFAARMGGEEFLLVMPVTEFRRPEDLLDTIVTAMQEQRFADAPDLVVTLSGGLVYFRSPEPQEQLIHRADTALYRAKQDGRNRWVRGDDDR